MLALGSIKNWPDVTPTFLGLPNREGDLNVHEVIGKAIMCF